MLDIQINSSLLFPPSSQWPGNIGRQGRSTAIVPISDFSLSLSLNLDTMNQDCQNEDMILAPIACGIDHLDVAVFCILCSGSIKILLATDILAKRTAVTLKVYRFY